MRQARPLCSASLKCGRSARMEFPSPRIWTMTLPGRLQQPFALFLPSQNGDACRNVFNRSTAYSHVFQRSQREDSSIDGVVGVRQGGR